MYAFVYIKQEKACKFSGKTTTLSATLHSEVRRKPMHRRSAYLLLVMLSACTSPNAPISATPVFTIGGEDDPVLRMALQSASTTYMVTMKNNTSYSFAPGLISTAALYKEGSVASSAFGAYVTAGGTATGDPLKLAKALGLTLGTSAFYVPALAPGMSITIAVALANSTTNNGRLSLAARVEGSVDDFIGIDGHSGNNKFSSFSIYGYDLNDSGGKVKRGNGTTGSTIKVTGSVVDATNCTTTLTTSATLIDQSFSAGTPFDHTWPYNIGFDGDFNGDWYTDGTTARMIDASQTLPTISGFVKFLLVCPAAGARLSISADVSTRYKQQASDTTLLAYFFDASLNLISVAQNNPLHGLNDRVHALYDVPIPAGTRKIAVVPVGYFAAGETESAHYYNLKATYDPLSKDTALASDGFSNTTTDAFGANQPVGWSDYGGDWYHNPADGHATVWNTAWSGETATALRETGMQKTFSLSGVAAGSTFSASAFAATTFTDATSKTQLRAKFDTGQEVSSTPLRSQAWGNLEIYRTPIPAGATSVQISVQLDFGITEQSAAYVDDLKLWTTK